MPRSLPPLTALRAFESAARLSSFTRAARELHVTPAAISHQIRGLEKYLGVTLFRRTGRRLELTDQGRVAASHFREGFERIARGVRQARSAGDSGFPSPSASRRPSPRDGRCRDSAGFAQMPGHRLEIIAGRSPSTSITTMSTSRSGLVVVESRARSPCPCSASVSAPLRKPRFDPAAWLASCGRPGRAPLLHDDSMRRVGRTTGWQEWLGVAKVRAVDVGRGGTHLDDGDLLLQAAAAGRGQRRWAAWRMPSMILRHAVCACRSDRSWSWTCSTTVCSGSPCGRTGDRGIHKWFIQELPCSRRSCVP